MPDELPIYERRDGLFRIFRTSDKLAEKPPIEGAFPGRHAWKAIAGETFTSTCWFIEAATITDLLALVARCDREVVIEDCHYHCDHPTIEIYDDWRE